uniref:Adenosine deaminase n=1 Tax=Timema douglasi TaxID=61478 RepID=A0A7R8VG46_TIMDO|nr:unnamed protein product [Timema douglasi]
MYQVLPVFQKITRAFVFFLVLFMFSNATHEDSYYKQRNNFISQEQKRFLGSEIVLTAREEAVNSLLMESKRQEFQRGMDTAGTFPPSRHFFLARHDIEQSSVFSLIRRMPKGASLHGHTFSLASTNFLINNLTYLPQLYICVDTAGVLNFKFSEKVPDDNCDWVLLEMLRASSGNATFVDEFIRKQITLETDHPTEAYPTITEVWEKFQDIFTTVSGLTRWRVAFEMYYNQVLKEFYEDNVMYLEIRGTIPKIYDLDGTIMPWRDFLTLMNQLNKQFSALHPDFLGTKLIISPSRTINDSVMDADIQRVVEAHKAFPDLVVGFDLVGQEDKGKSLLNFTEKLLHLPPGIDFFFHAGETSKEEAFFGSMLPT